MDLGSTIHWGAISLLLFMRNRKEKGGGRTQSSGEQLPYCFFTRNRKEKGGGRTQSSREQFRLVYTNIHIYINVNGTLALVTIYNTMLLIGPFGTLDR